MASVKQGTVLLSSIDVGATEREERSIGAVLVAAGRLKRQDVDNILRLQQEQPTLSFGDAAIRLGLINESDIEFALSRQFNYPQLARGESNIDQKLVSAYASSGPELESLRALRGQLMLRWFEDSNRNALTLISGERKEGRSFITANLAIMFALLGKKTLLVDADMRHPSQHKLFGLENRTGLSALLSDRGGAETIQRISGLLDLSVLPSGVLPPNPAELLSQPLFVHLLKELRREFDVILLDSPAATECTDGETLAVKAGAALIVARKNHTRMWRVRGVSTTVAQASAVVLGTVLNEY
jgi:protein-tyrosine kinase